MLLGAAYYPEHRERSKWEYDLDMMREASVNCLRVGEFAWCRFEPEMDKFDFSWMDKFNGLASKRGIQLLLCPPLRTPPAWLVECDPSVKLVRDDGVPLEFGSRYSFCINHPFLLSRGELIARRMAERYGRDANIVGWHLDNEHGDEPDCHCPICRHSFQEWCQKRYRDIHELNKAWGTVFWGLEFNSFTQIPTTAVSKTYHSPGHILAWRRFRSDSTVNAVRMQAAVMRKLSDKEITTNLQCWNPRTDYFEEAKEIDYCGMNYYPAYGDGQKFYPAAFMRTRGFKGRGVHVHELRNGAHMVPGREGNTPCPGEVERLILHCVANGADGIFHFRWRACPFGNEQSHGTITDYDGRPKRVYQEVKKAFEKLGRLSSIIDSSTVESEIAILFDFNTWWVMGNNAEWDGSPGLYKDHFDKIANTVKALNVNCDSVGTGGDFSKYRIIIVPALACADDALAGKFEEFVRNGGILIWHPLSGIKDIDAKIHADRLHPRLKKLLGVDIREFATFSPKESNSFEWNGKEYKGALFCDLPTLEGAQAQAQFKDIWFAGTPAMTTNCVGKGSAIYVMTFAEEKFYADLIGSFSPKPILEGDIPAALEVCERSISDGRRLIFLLNCSASEQQFSIPHEMNDVYNEETLKGECRIAPFGTRILVNIH